MKNAQQRVASMKNEQDRINSEIVKRIGHLGDDDDDNDDEEDTERATDRDAAPPQPQGSVMPSSPRKPSAHVAQPSSSSKSPKRGTEAGEAEAEAESKGKADQEPKPKLPRVEDLLAAKAKAKRAIVQWMQAFEAEHGRAPNLEDKKAVKSLFVNLKKVRARYVQ